MKKTKESAGGVSEAKASAGGVSEAKASAGGVSEAKASAGGVSVYISQDIVEVLEKKQKEIEEAGIKVGLDPLCLVKPSIGWMVRFQLRATLGLSINGVE